MKELKILILEDLFSDAQLIKRKLKRGNLKFTSITVDTREDFLKALDEFLPDIILADYRLPDFTGIEAVELAGKKYPDIPVIIVTASINEETAVNCMKNGAVDYVLKDNLSRLSHAIERAIEKKRIEEEKRRTDEELRTLNVELEKRVEERTTDLMKAQKELLENERLAVIGQLAASLGNELKDPLVTVHDYINDLKSKFTDTNGEVQEKLDGIDKAVTKVNRLIDELLEFVCVPESNPSQIDPVEIVKSAVSNISIPENIGLFIPEKKECPILYGDREQIERIVKNLLINAIQSMPSGGELFVKTGNLGNRGYLEVTDTGMGIEMEEMEQIFEPLYSTKSGGIGLGLSICKRYAQINGGKIQAKSIPGKGATFRLFLPLFV